jgi:hypothetical protein
MEGITFRSAVLLGSPAEQVSAATLSSLQVEGHFFEILEYFPTH